jgi:hypothetical protein
MPLSDAESANCVEDVGGTAGHRLSLLVIHAKAGDGRL